MDNNDFSNLGRKIQDTIQNAVDSMDFEQLNDTINKTVNQALDEARTYKDKMQQQQYQKQQYQKQQNWQQYQQQQKKQQYQQRPEYRNQMYAVAERRKQRNLILSPKLKSGIVSIVFGSVLAFVMVIALAGNLVEFFAKLGQGGFTGRMVNVILLLLFSGGSLYVLISGIRKNKWWKMARTYADIIGGRGFCQIQELAQRIGEQEDKVRRDVHKLIQKRAFREAYMDRKETCLMVNRIAYNYYLDSEKSLQEREAQEQSRQEDEAKLSPEVVQMIHKGEDYIRSIREANDAIPGEVISIKLDRLEKIIRRIFESVKKHPEQSKEMDKFMNYYLPTTLKLVNTYREFDALEVKGSNVTKAMEEIETTLDTINMAFEKLLDDLFQDAAFDVSTDISVLETMLQREGYKETGFK